jgi:SAM-dependent methyltransferase
MEMMRHAAETPKTCKYIAARTLAHYEQHAQSYWEGTRDHDVSQNIAALLKHISGPPPFDLLDFGCGPGRDLRTFRRWATAPSAWRARPARRRWRAPTAAARCWSRASCNLDLPSQRYDGVFANAVLFHVPSQALPQVLRQLQACLRPGGVLFSSNPRGDGQEGWNGERYGAFHDWPTWRALVTAAGFDELDHFYRPRGPADREQQPWLASVWRKR